MLFTINIRLNSIRRGPQSIWKRRKNEQTNPTHPINGPIRRREGYIRGDLAGAGEHVAWAAELYGQEADKLRAGWKHAPFPHQQADKPWTAEMRHAQADVLAEAWALEKQALAQIEKALDAIE